MISYSSTSRKVSHGCGRETWHLAPANMPMPTAGYGTHPVPTQECWPALRASHGKEPRAGLLADDAIHNEGGGETDNTTVSKSNTIWHPAYGECAVGRKKIDRNRLGRCTTQLEEHTKQTHTVNQKKLLRIWKTIEGMFYPRKRCHHCSTATKCWRYACLRV